MGIRFACNLCQHSLNIKRELAGKIGVCPKCGGRIRIPSDDSSTSAAGLSRNAIAVEQSVNTIGDNKSTAVAQTVGNSLRSPLDEIGPQWFVRPPAGGQYGPASGETIRTWITENRVTGSTLIWRDGWPQWRAARDSLPELAESKEHTLASNHPAHSNNSLDEPLTNQSEPIRERSSHETRFGNQLNSRSQRRIALIVALAILSTILIVTLIFLAIRS